MNQIDFSYRTKDGLEVEDTGDDVLIYLPNGDQTLYLNETAAIVWRLCDGKRTGVEIIQLLSDAYPDEENFMQLQVQEALTDFIERGLIESVP
jgi:hypothetical protein